MGKYDKIIKDYELHCKQIASSTRISVNETVTQKRDRIKKLEAHYGRWFEYYFESYCKSKTTGKLIACSRFHIAAANLLIKNPIIYLLLNWFRGAAKSVHICMGIPLYLMTKKEMRFMVLVGENEAKGKRLLSDIQAQLKFNQRFINDYGKQFQFGDWADGSFTTKEGVAFQALGLGQSPRGLRELEQRPDYIACDDLDTKKRCKNPRLINEAVEWIMEDLWGTMDEGYERFVFANNRIHKNSIMANSIKEFKVAKEKAKKAKIPVVHYVSRVIAHDKNFNSTWPEKYTSNYWREKRATRPSRSYNREYLDNPQEAGKVFKAENLQYRKPGALGKFEALVIYGDLSYKDEGDFKALRFWGKKGREYDLIDCYVRQGSRKSAAEWLYDLYEDLGNQSNRLNIHCKIEGLFAMDEFANDFDEEGKIRGWQIDVVPDKRPKEGKYDRIESTSGRYERRRVFYNIDKKDNADFSEGTEQLLAFEKGSGAHDDSPDADHGAFAELDLLTFIESFEPRMGTRSNKTMDY